MRIKQFVNALPWIALLSSALVLIAAAAWPN